MSYVELVTGYKIEVGYGQRMLQKEVYISKWEALKAAKGRRGSLDLGGSNGDGDLVEVPLLFCAATNEFYLLADINPITVSNFPPKNQ